MKSGQLEGKVGVGYMPSYSPSRTFFLPWQQFDGIDKIESKKWFTSIPRAITFL